MVRERGIIYAAVMVVLVLGLFSSGCARSAPPLQDATLAEPTLTTGLAGPMTVSARASIAPCRKANLSFNISGRLKQVMVTDGQFVKAGQELATLEALGLGHDLARAEAALKGAQAELAKVKAGPRSEQIAVAEAAAAASAADVKVAEAAVEAARAQADQAQAELARAKAGLPSGQIAAGEATAVASAAAAKAAETAVDSAQRAEADVQAATAELAQARSRLEAARARADQAQAELALVKAGAWPEDVAIAESVVAAAEANLAEAHDDLAGSTVTAPFDGVVGAVLINEGEAVSAQVPVFRLGDMNHLCIQTLDLSEVNVPRVRAGQEATVRVDALPGQTFAARVTTVAPMATDRQGDRVFAVVLEFEPGALDDVRWGMNASVQIAAE